MDGREVHYANTRTGVMDHSWSSRGGHVIKVVCHAAAPMTANPGFRQYDLFIDGQSFFSMPKVYEMGLRPGMPAPGAGAPMAAYPGAASSSPRAIEYNPDGTAIRAPRNTVEEDTELQRAINASLEESRRHLEQRGRAESGNTQPTSNNVDLFEFDSAPAPSNDFMNQPPPQQQQQYGAPPPDQQYGAPSPQYGAPSPQYGAPSPQYGAPPPGQPMLALPSSTSYGSQPPPQQQQQYAPAPVPHQSPPPAQPNFSSPAPAYAAFAPSDDPFAPKPPSHNDISNGILSAYGSGGGGSPSAATPSNASAQGMWSPQIPQQQRMPGQFQSSPHEQAPQQNGHGPALTMDGLAKHGDEPVNEFEAAMRKLVNFDHIDEPAEQQMKLTMKKQEDEKAKKNKGKSRGLAPVAIGQVGSAATLSQITQVKPTVQKKEGIMNAPPPTLFSPHAAMAGALVVHGQGPPPLQKQGQGFGVGAGQANGYGGAGYGYPPQQQGYPPQQGHPPQQQGYSPQPQQGYQYR